LRTGIEGATRLGTLAERRGARHTRSRPIGWRSLRSHRRAIRHHRRPSIDPAALDVVWPIWSACPGSGPRNPENDEIDFGPTPTPDAVRPMDGSQRGRPPDEARRRKRPAIPDDRATWIVHEMRNSLAFISRNGVKAYAEPRKPRMPTWRSRSQTAQAWSTRRSTTSLDANLSCTVNRTSDSLCVPVVMSAASLQGYRYVRGHHRRSNPVVENGFPSTELMLA
jgi:hypothetical protein